MASTIAKKAGWQFQMEQNAQIKNEYSMNVLSLVAGAAVLGFAVGRIKA
jgi:sensor domain CHASE-containing protein